MPVSNQAVIFNEASPDFRFASAVASFGMILRDSPHKGNSTLDAVLQTAENSRGADVHGYREEFVELVRKARDLKPVP
jgi:Ca-activated chloride channel family protein